MLTAAIYARYSSENQKETSILGQIARCRDAAARFGCTVNGHVYSDKEISGTTAERPGYRSLMSAAKEHKFEAILVEAQDRLWRDQGEMHNALKRLRFWGIKVFSVAAGADLTDRNGKMLVSVKGLMDETYIEDLRDKTRRGMLGQIRRGFTVGGRAYGYRSKPRLDSQGQIVGSQQMPDPNEAAIIRRIFKMYAAGMSPKAIALRLNVERIQPPRTSRARKPLGWTPTTIAGSASRAIGILNNHLYIGKLVWNRHEKVRDPDTGKPLMRLRPKEEWIHVEAPHLRIVPDDLWTAVKQRQNAQHRPTNSPGRKPRYLFSGLLVCSECSQHYVIRSTNHRVNYYGCATNTNRGREICSNDQLVRRDRLEETLLRLVFDQVFSPDTVAYVTKKVNEALARRAAPLSAARKRKQVELDEAQRQLENIKQAIRQGILTDTTKQMLEEAEQKVREVEVALRSPFPAKQKVATLPSVVEGYLKDLRESLNRNPEKARGLLAKLLGPITLRREGGKLIAEMKGNLPALLTLDEEVLYNPGSGGLLQPQFSIARPLVVRFPLAA